MYGIANYFRPHIALSEQYTVQWPNKHANQRLKSEVGPQQELAFGCLATTNELFLSDSTVEM